MDTDRQVQILCIIIIKQFSSNQSLFILPLSKEGERKRENGSNNTGLTTVTRHVSNKCFRFYLGPNKWAQKCFCSFCRSLILFTPSVPHLHNAGRHDRQDEVEPDVGEDAPEGGDKEHSQVFDLACLAVGDCPHTDPDDDKHVEGGAANDGSWS